MRANQMCIEPGTRRSRAQDAAINYFTRFDQQAFDQMYVEYLKQPPEAKVSWGRFAKQSAFAKPQPLPMGSDLVSALGLPDGSALAAVKCPDGVWRWDGKTWTESLAGATGLLSRSGATVLLIYAGEDSKDVRYRALVEGRWSDSKVVAQEPVKHLNT